MRLFVGVPVPATPAFATVTQQLLSMAPGSRAVPEGTWHVTLRFLGDARPEPAAAALDEALRGRHALAGLVEGLGGFPSTRQATIAWAGVQAAGLPELAQGVRAATAGIGQREAKPFHAHVTLVRLARPVDLHELVQQHANTGFGEGWLDRVVLWRSELGPGGPRYTPVHTVTLAHPGDDQAATPPSAAWTAGRAGGQPPGHPAGAPIPAWPHRDAQPSRPAPPQAHDPHS